MRNKETVKLKGTLFLEVFIQTLNLQMNQEKFKTFNQPRFEKKNRGTG